MIVEVLQSFKVTDGTVYIGGTTIEVDRFGALPPDVQRELGKKSGFFRLIQDAPVMEEPPVEVEAVEETPSEPEAVEPVIEEVETPSEELEEIPPEELEEKSPEEVETEPPPEESAEEETTRTLPRKEK